MEQSNNTQLPAEVVSRINLEAKQFAFYNYVTAFLHPNAVFENMDSWPPDARVCFYSILHYMSREDLCWPYKGPTLATEWAQWKVKHDELKTELLTVYKEWKAYESENRQLKERCEKIETALKQFITYHETGLLPDRGTYEKGVEAMKKEGGNATC